MKLSYRMCALPFIAGLVMASAFACSEGSETADGAGGASSAEGGSGSAEGGASSTGGSSAAGGVTTTATAASAVTKAWEFADSNEGFMASWGTAFDLTDSTLVDDTASAALKTGTVTEWMATEGYGGVEGFVKISVPFATTQSSYQQVEVASNLTEPIDITDKVLTCWVKLVSGGSSADANNPSGGKMVVKTGTDWVYASGQYTSLPLNQWVAFTLSGTAPNDVGTSGTYDATQIVQIAVSIETGGGATTAEPAVVDLDHCWY